MDSFEEKRSMLHFNEDEIAWTEERYSLTTLREKGNFKLPTLICITSGYFGKDEKDTFSSDDILVLYEWKMQERILAKKGKYTTSIPLDFEHKFEVMEPGMPRRLMHLSQITQKYKPPVQVRFGPSTPSQQELSGEAIGPFTLMSSHYLEYATASTTAKGMISTEELLCFPIYRQVRFVVATRLHGLPIEQHSQYLHSFLKHTQINRTLGALQYTELLDTMEEYDYMRTIPIGTWGKPPNDRTRQYTRLQKGGPIHEYEPIEINSRACGKTTSSVPGKGKRSPNKKGGSKHARIPIELSTRMTPDIHTPKGNPSSSTIQKSSIFREIDARPTGLCVPLTGRQRPVATVSPTNPSSSIKTPKRDPETRVDTQPPPLFPRSSAKPPVPPRPQNPIANKPASLPRPALGIATATDLCVTKSTPSLSLPRHSPGVTVSLMPIPEEMKHTTAESSPSLFPVETCQIKGSVSPHPLVIKTLEDVPADLSDLSVDQVCHCLTLLNLGEFAPKFRHALIDGRILSGCRVDDLKQEFSMGHLSARKLVMFANEGWRPKE